MSERAVSVDMLLNCPKCGVQHVDEPSEGWDNPPHRSHLCLACGCIWRPADVPTNGVAAIATSGSADTYTQPPSALSGDTHTREAELRSAIVRDLIAERKRYNFDSPTWRAFGLCIDIVEKAS